MAALGAPVVQGVADALAGQDAGEAVGRAALFPGAASGREVDVAVGMLL